MKENPLLVISCLVYNHEPYLRDCFEGFVMQKTNFRFVAIVHDDASTDKSAEIIREYAEKYPDIIKPIYETENQYSKHNGSITRIMNAAIDATGAKYVAFCEGDDYWTDPHKLQRQVDFMDANSDYVATADNGLVRNEMKNTEYSFNTSTSHDVTMEEVIITRRFPTAGVLCRSLALNGYIATCKISVDTILWCWLISKGKFRYCDIISSVYRKGPQGMTIYTEPYVFARKVETWNLKILQVFNIAPAFIHNHIAKMFLDSAIASLKQRQLMSVLKCTYNFLIYTYKSRCEYTC